MKLYLIGSLRNPKIPTIANELRTIPELEVFDDWYSAGPEADDKWKEYETQRGHSYGEALKGYAARHVYAFDHHHLATSDITALILPAGRSGHLEFGFSLGQGKRGFILLDEEDVRWDVMYQFATYVCKDLGELKECIQRQCI